MVMNKRNQLTLIILGLILLTGSVFWQVSGFQFLSFDDASYIPDNPYVRDGLTKEGIVWAFTTRHHGYWHPVTWIVHMSACQLFGLNAGAHHAVNLLVHTVNVLLLFGLLMRMTGATGRSAFVAALFAIHPMHVESVAWIARLNDLLCTSFWILTLWAYVLYTERRDLRTYILTLITFIIGLMAKPMIVTLPIVLLLLDFWPLQRIQKSASWKRLILEKVPFLFFSAASSLLTFLNQVHGNVAASLEQLPLTVRCMNAIVACGTYLFRMIWPDQMACLYPYNLPLPTWQVASSLAALIGISALAIWFGTRHRYLLTGWLWFLVMLVPVIGLVQVGPQSMADRYTYLSYVGLFIMVTWSVSDWAKRFSVRSSGILSVAAGLIVLTFAARAWFQVRVWKDSLSLFQHAAEVTKDNYMAYNNLGILFADEGRLDEAIAHYREALRISPQFAFAQNNIGSALMQKGQLDDAIAHFHEALRLNPDYPEALNNLGIALAKQGRFDEAIGCFMVSLKANPGNFGRQKNLLLAIDGLPDKQKAAAYYRAALRIAESANETELADLIREKL
jgi:protein O-mannosyl-transferase